MLPLPLTKIGNLSSVFESCIDEMNLKERSSVEFLLKRLTAGYVQRSIDAYVDNPDNPRHVLVLEKTFGVATEESILEIRLIWSHPEERGKGTQPDFEAQFMNYAAIFGCDAILASSCVYRGSTPIDALWKSLGFEKQEIVYVKLLPKQ